MREKYLLGANKYNEIVFGVIDVRNWNGKTEFSASFNTVRPFNGTNFDMEEYFKDYVDSLDDYSAYNLIKSYDCRPSELSSELASDCSDVRDALDCSLYPEEYEVNGEYWYFESCSGGQHDTREEMEEIINTEAYNLLHELWDKYHLKEVDEEVISKVENLRKILAEVDEVEWITDYIERHMEEL